MGVALTGSSDWSFVCSGWERERAGNFLEGAMLMNESVAFNALRLTYSNDAFT